MALAGIIGRKLGMTQVYTPEGVLVPVTVIEAGPCTVVAARQKGRDGYEAVQLGFGTRRAKRVSKPVQGQYKACGGGPFATLREVRLLEGEAPAVGTTVTVADVFRPGEKVQVSGISKGHGTAGVMKRHNFSGFPGSHGTHEYFRHGGSIGNRSYPGRVFKGKRMAGRWGAELVTVPNLSIVAVRPEENLLLVRGAVPGARNGTVVVRKKGEARR
ncbi:MAG: 50S ribosomal protein L3 [Candidatus Binatia bacterium]